MERNVKILVAQHKEANVFQNDVYTPIHVGKSLSNKNLNILGDDSGDNISSLNPAYCELTAQYWAWKNLDVEYIGLCHYRRYFEKEYTERNIEEELKGYDIILSKRVVFRTNILTWLSQSLIPEDIALFHLYMSKQYKNNMQVYNSFYQERNWMNPANMFVCKKELFDDFCSWQFGILEKVRELLPISPYSRERRILGYLAEPFLSFYAYQNKLKVKEVGVVSMIGDNYKCNLKTKLKEIKSNILFARRKSYYNISPASYVGLKLDGFIDKIDTL